MALSKSPYGPWRKVGKDGLVVKPSDNPELWTHRSRCGVTNPGFMKHPEGGYVIYFKALQQKGTRRCMIGAAIAENLEGPYVQLPFPVLKNSVSIEAPVPFKYKGKFGLFTTDNHGIIEKGGGLIWTSTNGLTFDKYEQAYRLINHYVDYDMSKAKIHYGRQGKFEELQVLEIDGKAKYFYIVSGCNIYGGNGAASYILKYVDGKRVKQTVK